MPICDRVTVLRDGRLVGAPPSPTPRVDGIVRLMVGREVDRLFEHPASRARGAVALRGRGPDPPARRATRPSLLDDVSFTCARARSWASPAWSAPAAPSWRAPSSAPARSQPARSWSTAGRPRSAPRATPSARHRPGAGGPQAAGAVPGAGGAQNCRCRARPPVARARLGRRGARGRAGRGVPPELGIRMASAEQAIANLSGGNQQKVVLARWLAPQPRC